jgi:hypothetical protein
MIENLSPNADETFKDYLGETLKRFLDKEFIVQEAACTAFTTMIQTKKDKLEPYLVDIFKIITSVFDIYQGTSLLTLYEIISLLTESFEDHFKNPSLIEDLVKCVVKKWYTMLNTEDYKNISPVFDMVCSIIKVSTLMLEFVNDFLNGSLRLLEINLNNYFNNNNDVTQIDREVVSKSIDLISVLCQTNPDKINEHSNKDKIVEYTYNIIETGDSYVKHYVIALIGDICTVDAKLILPKFKFTIEVLIKNLELPVNKFEALEVEKLSICNNSCWTIGLMAVHLPNETKPYVNQIMKALMKILSYSKVNI